MSVKPLPDDAPRHEEDYSNAYLDPSTLHALEERLRQAQAAERQSSTVDLAGVEHDGFVHPIGPLRHPLLAERETTHGNFGATALITQRFKEVARNTPNWQANMTDVQREALEGIFVKIARILSGDPNHPDHWRDIAGGAHLVEEHL